MTRYPNGHHPFVHRGGPIDDVIARRLGTIAREPSLGACLAGMELLALTLRGNLEELRARLYRGEQLIGTHAIPHGAVDQLPDGVRLLLESLHAAKPCLEEWMESRTCAAIIRRTRPESQS